MNINIDDPYEKLIYSDFEKKCLVAADDGLEEDVITINSLLKTYAITAFV